MASPRAMFPLSTEARSALCIALAHGVVVVVAVAAVATLFCVHLALRHELAWATVALPPLVASIVLWLFLTIATAAWIGRCRALVDGQEAENSDFSLDLVLTVFKFTVAMLVYLGIVVLILSLFWLEVSPWVLASPVAVLGLGHLCVGIFLKQPEVSPVLHLTLGSSLLAHALVLAAKVAGLVAWPWHVVFAPSWLTYAAVFACLSGWPKATAEAGVLLVRYVAWLAAWAMLLLAQVSLSLRLDGLWHCPMALVLLPAVAAVLLFAAAQGPAVVARVHRILATVFDAAICVEQHGYATFDPPDSFASPTWPAPMSVRSAGTRSSSTADVSKDLVLPPPAA